VIKLKILELTDEVFDYYRENTRHNKDITRDQAARKLSRNIMLAKEVPPRNERDRLLNNRMYHFGNLHIVVRDGIIIHLRNYKNQQNYRGWELDRFKFVELTKEFGIEG
jgi:hypothetical protein